MSWKSLIPKNLHKGTLHKEMVINIYNFHNVVNADKVVFVEVDKEVIIFGKTKNSCDSLYVGEVKSKEWWKKSWWRWMDDSALNPTKKI